MIDSNEVYDKIINYLQENGPSLPMTIAKSIKIDSLFISAFLSELLNKRKIKLSHLKIGSTKLYLLPGQEAQLEKFSSHLSPFEIDALNLLKQNKIIKDNSQNPQIKNALRNIKDFAIPFEKNNEIFWRYIETPSDQIKINPPSNLQKTKKEHTPEIKIIPQKNKQEFANPLAKKETKKISQTQLLAKITDFLKTKNYKIIEIKENKKREIKLIIQIETELGPTNFLTLAKDKKNISETDLKNLLSESQAIPLPALLIYPEKISKKAQEYITQYFSILKILKIPEQ